MNLRLALVTARRILTQLHRDKRTIALLLAVPCVMSGLLAWILDARVYDHIGPALIGLFPMMVMFIVTSIATLRERQSGTLERLLTTPLGKGDFMLGYALAFAAVAVVQALVVTAFAFWVCGLDLVGPVWLLILLALGAAVLGTSLGLLASGFARTEFQAVQFMPAFILPQFLLCGIFPSRDELPNGLAQLSDVLPLSYVVDAMNAIATKTDPYADLRVPVLVVVGFIAVALALGSATLRRRTP